MKKTITITTPSDITAVTSVCRAMLDARGPVEVIVQDLDKSRTSAQNRLQFLWYSAAAEQLEDETAEEKRAYCKLHFGVAIMRAHDDFREAYDTNIRQLPYDNKLKLMVGVINFPVTSLMSVKEFGQFLEAVEVFFMGQLVDLPKPEDLYNLAVHGSRKRLTKTG